MDMPPVPDRMKHLPLWRGRFPIHFTVFVDPKTKEPDFKVVNTANKKEALAKNLCHLCGQRMSPPYAFIGGLLCHRNRLFVDGPMHEECARYATKACPYLANADGGHSLREARVGDDHVAVTIEGAAPGRPHKMALMFTDGYDVQGEFIKARFWTSVEWDAMPERKA